jgi:molybdopterin guanine dinucleotide-containing S/N-oxide reductase-like protein
VVGKQEAGRPAVEKMCVKGLGFNGNVRDANTVAVDVKDGKILRIKPLHYDWKYSPETFNPWNMEVRGQVFEPEMKSLIPPITLGYKKRVYSPARVRYPLKRVDWDPNGNRNVENRGKSCYVRISWEEAIDLIVSEIKRIKEKYGTYAILSQSDGHGETKVVHGPHGCARRLLSMLGGYTLQCRNADSWEGWYWGAKHVWGMEPVGQQRPLTNLMWDIANNTELLLFWGCDPETTSWGWGGQMASRFSYWFTKLGIKSVYICPDLNYGAAVHADRWIPIRPNTDAAMYLAIAYVWIKDDTYDKEYVATHTYGFEKFEEYVLGKTDGVPKTPDWAEGKTAVPSSTIKALAREWASKRTTIAIGNGGSMIRGPYSTEPARLQVYLLAMQGLGKPGCNQVKMQEWGLWHDMKDYPTPRPMVYPKVIKAHRGAWAAASVGKALPDQILPKCLIHEAILNPPLSWYGTTVANEPLEDQFKKYVYPVEGCSEVHMIWSDTPSWTTCWNDSNTYIQALKSPKIEFILVQHPWLENDSMFADIILPVSTKLEQEDIGTDIFSGQFNMIMHEAQCVEPVGESKSDYEVVCLIAEKLGMLEEYTEGKSIEEWIKTGFDTSGIQDMTTFKELKEKGYYVIPTDPEWQKYNAGLYDFYKDPEKNPLKTPSGKIEFYSQNLAKYFPDDMERPPVARWIEKGESHDESISSSRVEKYPLLIVSNHPRWRVHSQHDDITWLREIRTCKVRGQDGYLYEPLWINPVDAEKRGISSGDIVEVYNERGAVLGGAYVTERVMPGVVYMDHGARLDPIVPGKLDRGGAINTISPRNLTSRNSTGMATSGYLVEVRPADIVAFKKQYPEAFNRPTHPTTGVCFDQVLARDK